MNSWVKRGFLILIIMLTIVSAANAESLFTLRTSQIYYAEPHSWFGGVRAKTIGDIVTIILSEQLKSKDSLTYNADRSSNTVNRFSDLINSLFGNREVITPKVNNFGGQNVVESTTTNARTVEMTDKVTAQVIQLMPNGNLLVQGKKTLVSTNERVEMVVSGIVDPRYINSEGEIDSSHVANLQFAMSGKGSVSRSGGEGIINRFIRYLF